MLYMYRYLQSKTTISRRPFYAIVAINALAILMATVALFTRTYSTFDAANFYHVQETYWVGQVSFMLVQLIYLVVTIRHFGALNTRERVCLVFYPLFNLFCLSMEFIVPGLWLSYMGYSLTLFFIYINLQADQQERIKRQDAELADARISIMLSQIQPHFLYNTLNAINYLYSENPQAQKAILTFAAYLRANMDSLAQKEPIPFSKELEHVKQYLWLEKLRFEDRLDIRYEIDATDFTIPVLTLQPLVENAVRYGITAKQAGGTVIIKTEETPRAYRVLVIDDGNGFDPRSKPSDGRSHTGIANVRMRLAHQSGGTLAIESTPGKGTTAIIELPKEKAMLAEPVREG